ncbi:unnamed protein product, partial [Prorocentrum cordatum]
AAVEALNDGVFRIELTDPPPPDPEDKRHDPGSVLLKDFPGRWQSTDVATLLHGAVRPSSLLGIDMLPVEDGDPPRGSARVRLRDIMSAREVARELRGQKVAGRPIIVELENEEDDGDAGSWALATVDQKEKDRGTKYELCNDYKRGRCDRGDRCRFSHGEDDPRPTRRPGAKTPSPRRSRDRSRGWRREAAAAAATAAAATRAT